MPHARDDLDLANRKRKSLELRRMGHSYNDIVQELRKEGWLVTATQVWADVNEELRKAKRETSEEAEQIRQVEMDRLDMALKAIMPRVNLGDDDAIQSMLRIQLRRAKLIGLDAPQKREIDDKRDKNTRSREQLLAAFVEVTRKLEGMGIKLPQLPAHQNAIEAEIVPTTSQESDQSANDSSNNFEIDEKE